jgi:Holliday junction resolvasome RuvABC endonuclease subunit
LPNINGESFQEYVADVDRFDSISDWAINLCVGASEIAVEGYSYGSKGKVFNLAENMGIFKHKLYKAGVPVTVIEPSKAKKLATGKGNADKQAMYEAFSKETNTDLLITFQQKTLSNPVTDIVDSYYILKSLLAAKN